MDVKAGALSNYQRLVLIKSSLYFHKARNKRNFKLLHQSKDEQMNQHREMGRI
jgi:hypothetical protein